MKRIKATQIHSLLSYQKRSEKANNKYCRIIKTLIKNSVNNNQYQFN